MQFSLTQSSFQQLFLTTVDDSNRSYYKSILKNFNLTLDLNHTFTNELFNLLQQELLALKEILLPLYTSRVNLLAESKNQKKVLLSQYQNKSSTSRFFDHPFIVERSFDLKLHSCTSEHEYYRTKFTLSMDRFFTFAGLYEELYAINTLNLTAPVSSTLSYVNGVYTCTKGHSTATFQIFPFYFIVKYLFNDKPPLFSVRSVLEYLLQHIIDSEVTPQFYLSIADNDQMTTFFTYCNMKYLSDFVLTAILQNKNFLIPKIINSTFFL